MSDHSLKPRTFVGLDGVSRTHQVRHFKAATQHWTVYENSTADQTLIFETDGIARRVRTYPANWAELPDDELYVLSWST
ncbi:MAG TPA: hypothetical protein VJN70_02765 [Gemmatimonadaceae bacterium]|nr:hypothetical protein [Gemmatimonadaceae bacterium]